jgi:uncharacterized DUF497 family protein
LTRFGSTRFKWDENKRQANIRKHRVDFEDAKEVFFGPMRVELDQRREYGEERNVGIGRVGAASIVVVYTKRGDDVIRLISARKAGTDEIESFEKEVRKGEV